MQKLTAPGLLALVLWLCSCSPSPKTEKEEIAFWNHAFVDSSFRLLYDQRDTTHALQYFDASIEKYDGTGAYLKAVRYSILANFYYFFSDSNHATAAMIDAALLQYPTPKLQEQYPRSYVGLLLFGGHIAYRLHQYGKANDYYFKAKKLGDKHLTPCERAAFNYNIAMVLYRQRNFLASRHYFQQAYQLQNSCDPQTAAIILQQQEIQSNIGLCDIELKNYSSALQHFDFALHLAEQSSDSLGPASMERIRGVIYGNKAKAYFHLNQPDKAKLLCQKSLEYTEQKGHELEYARSIKLLLAALHGKKNEFSAMAAVLQDVQPTIFKASMQQRMEWNRLMAEHLENVKRPDQAIGYLKNYFSLTDSIEKEQAQLATADVARQIVEKEQEFEIGILKKDKEHAFIFICVMVLFGVMAVVIILLINWNYLRSKKNLEIQKKLNREIQLQKAAREEEIRKRHQLITDAVILAQENERSLIGLELHDNINQVLTTVKLHNEMVLEGVSDARTILPRTLKLLQNCINEIRNLSKKLSAPTLGRISLEESVRDLIESINSTAKVKITHEITGLVNESLDRDLHLGIYRILQEGLNNVLKHSEASAVFVSLDRTSQGIYLSIKDNGKGFRLQKDRVGIGLMNMQTRAENLNGMFELESQPGEGCVMKVVVPMRET